MYFSTSWYRSVEQQPSEGNRRFAEIANVSLNGRYWWLLGLTPFCLSTQSTVTAKKITRWWFTLLKGSPSQKPKSSLVSSNLSQLFRISSALQKRTSLNISAHSLYRSLAPPSHTQVSLQTTMPQQTDKYWNVSGLFSPTSLSPNKKNNNMFCKFQPKLTSEWCWNITEFQLV